MNWREKENIKIVVGINSLVATSQPAYSNHIQFFYRLGRSYKNIEITLVNPARMSIDRMRNMAAEVALKWEADFLLFLDDDVLVPFTGLAFLLDADADIVAGDVLIRGYPFPHMFFKYNDKKELLAVTELTDGDPGPIDVDAVGFSFCLIKTGLLKEIPKPFFLTGPRNTEDIYFCLKCKLTKPDTTIMVDTRVSCGHMLNPYPITPENVVNYKKYYEAQYPQAIAQSDKDRGNDYYAIVGKRDA